MSIITAYVTPTEIVEYFHVKPTNPTIRERNTIESLASLNPEWENTLDLAKLIRNCEKLVTEGVLVELSSGNNILERCYFAPNFNESDAKYGKYDFIADGFEKIIERFSTSVLPVVVEKNDGSHDLGTSFVVGDNRTIFTARHVIEDMKSIRILRGNGESLPIYAIFVSNDERIDIALVITNIPDIDNIQPLKISNQVSVLDEILSIGYPPIPGFDALKVYDISHINSFVRLSKGRIVGSGHSYLDSQDFLLFNARVKGGNSGGPIINKYGLVTGMLVQIPISSEDSSKIDNLGYGIAVTGQSLLDAISFLKDGRELRLNDLGDCEYSTQLLN